MKATDGPWVFDENCVVDASGERGIAVLEPITGFWVEGQPITDEHEIRANGALIAAAPELLAACRYVTEFKGPMAANTYATIVKRCEAAIAKAVHKN